MNPWRAVAFATGTRSGGARRLVLRSLAAIGLALGGCHRGADVPCEAIPTTADGCREVCHDRGVEMTFFRYAPGVYRCDAICTCADTTLR